MKLLIFLLLILSCKTQEQIQREQMVDNMAIQVQQGQKLSAEFTVRLQHLEEKLTQKIGKLEEIQHNQGVKFSQEFTTSKGEMNQLISGLDLQKKAIIIITEQMVQQKRYLDKLLLSLNKLAGVKPSKKRSSYNQAMFLYRKGKYAVAQNELLKLLNNKRIKGNKKARVIHNLGMIAYMDRKYSDAVTLFSRLYTQYPSSPYTPRGLLFLGKSFKRINRKDEAKQVLQELVKKYPKSKYKKEAKKLLK
ncbi:MAG: tetratricopeptide repeat protein [Deltaproteobacteria bacterium]|nr:MAG: tetratricopeptide repeat protein [Deltaproteobacteria bacterium]